MDQVIFASLSHTHYWYEVGMLKVPARNHVSTSQVVKYYLEIYHSYRTIFQVPWVGRIYLAS